MLAPWRVHRDDTASALDHTVMECLALGNLIDEFAGEMKTRLAQMLRDGHAGWDDPQIVSTLAMQQRLEKNVDNGQHVDAAIGAALLWNRNAGKA